MAFSADEPDPIAIMNAYADQIGQQTGYRPYVLYGTTPLNFKRADRGYVDMRWRRTLRRRARRKNRRQHDAYPLCAGEGHKLYYRPRALASECERLLCHALLPDDAGGELYWHPHALAPCVRPFGWLPAGLPA